MKKLLAAAFAAALAGCTHQVAISPDTFSVAPAATARLAKGSVSLNNGYPAAAPVSIPVEKHTYIVDQMQMTATAIVMLQRALEKQGLSVSADGAKAITVRVHEPTSRFNLIGLVPQFWGAVTLDAELAEGAVVSASHENPSPISLQRAFEGAVLHALNRLLADDRFVAYVNGPKPLAASRPKAVVPTGVNDELYDPETGLLKEPSEEK